MLIPAAERRIWLCVAPADMRRSFDGLAALARNHLGEDPAGGDWFVFVNRRRTIVKVLSFDGGIDSRGDVDVFRVDLPGSAAIEARTVGRTDTRGELLDSTGARLLMDDDAGPGGNFSMRSGDLDPGVYYVEVRGDEGPYAVNVRLSGNRDHGDDFESSTLLKLHSAADLAGVSPQVLLATAGRIWPDARDADVFRVDVSEPSAVVVRASGGTDTYASLHSPDGTELAMDDGGTGNFRIEANLDSGVYYVRVGGYGVGAYRVLGSATATVLEDEEPPTTGESALPAPTITALSPTSIRAEWTWEYVAGESDVFELEITPRGGRPGTVCNDFGGGPSGTFNYRLTVSGVAPATTYDVRYRHRPSGSCDAGAPGPWSGAGSVTTPADDDGESGDYCRDDDEVGPGGRCDVYGTVWYFEVESSGTGCLRGGANICSGGGINWRTGDLVFVAESGAGNVWTIEDVEPEPADGAAAFRSTTTKMSR